jgi:hypothetical protein
LATIVDIYIPEVDLLVPSLFSIVRSLTIPTTLRSSAISLLAECEKTNSLSLLQYSGDLFEAMIDLLQVESVAVPGNIISGNEKASSTDEVKPTITVDSHPTSTNSKLPPLRRAALHFLMRLVQQATVDAYQSGSMGQAFSIKRARTTVAYVASTDEDAVVRVMAREVLDALKDLVQASVGM